MRQSMMRDHLAPARALRRQPDLAARLACRLEDGHLVAALAGDARGLQARRAGADDDDLPPRRRPCAIACGIVSSRPVAGLWMQ